MHWIAVIVGNDGRKVIMQSDSIVEEHWGFLMKFDKHGAIEWHVPFSRAIGI